MNRNNIKIIITLSCIVTLILGVAGVAWVYAEKRNQVKLFESYQDSKEVKLLSGALATLQRMEGENGLVEMTTNPDRVLQHDSLMIVVLNQINALKKVSVEPQSNSRLDSLKMYVVKRESNASELARLMDSYQDSIAKEIARQIEMNRRDLAALNRLMKNIARQQTTDAGSSPQINRSAVTLPESVLPSLRSMFVRFIQGKNQSFQRRSATMASQLILKQNELYTVREKMNSDISQIVKELENEENQKRLNLLKRQVETAEHFSETVAIVAFIALFFAVILAGGFAFLMFMNHRLLDEIKEEKNNTNKLLDSRGQLLLTITHDIKAPISSILGYLELMKEDKPSSQHNYYIDNMQHSATHILDLTRNLLDFHSLDTTLQKNDPLPFSPHNLLTDIYESFIPEARKKELYFDLDIDIEEQEVYISNPYRIRQILNNILSNALKYTPPKGSVLLSAFLVKTKRKTELLVSVKDTGPGINKEDINRIFEEFRRLDYTSEGLGLGLSIALKLAQSLGGSISVDSTPGKGSVFTVVLPLMKSDAESVPARLLQSEKEKADKNQKREIVSEFSANASSEFQAPADRLESEEIEDGEEVWEEEMENEEEEIETPEAEEVEEEEIEEVEEEEEAVVEDESPAGNQAGEETSRESKEEMAVAESAAGMENVARTENVSEFKGEEENAIPKILFIDNDGIQLNLLSNLLKRKGLDPYTCSSAVQALDMIRQEHFDMVFTDIRMPDMNGFELVSRIRNLGVEETKTLPVIGLSALAQVSEEKYKEAGFSDFLAKPFTSGQLLDIIYKYTADGKDGGEENLALQEENGGFQALIKFAGNDKKAGLSIIHSFIEETEKNRTQLEQAFEIDDWETVQEISHKMLPLMKMISAKKLVLLLQDYEKGGKSKENRVLLLALIQKKIKEAASIDFSTI
ncbi:MAG: hybrid sensor histidine kinase/response regulator [Candidatus Azobacteroides sp.]|nr:hybrid sensor histidine kinase/response regulator [Candidatus Azobacteroides sp.]